MPEETPAVTLLFSSEFKAQLRALAKRYRSIRADLQPLLDELRSGNFVGDRASSQSYTQFIKCSSRRMGKWDYSAPSMGANP